MAKKATSYNPAVIFPALPPEREGDEIIPLRQLARIVAALPLHRVMPLSEAFDQVRSCLRSGELAAAISRRMRAPGV